MEVTIIKYFIDFFNQYGVSIIHGIAVSIISYASLEAKKIYNKHFIAKTKKDVVEMVCMAINQVYPNLSGEEKLNKAIINCNEILNEKGIKITDLELRMYIESLVCCVSNKLNINKTSNNE